MDYSPTKPCRTRIFATHLYGHIPGCITFQVPVYLVTYYIIQRFPNHPPVPDLRSIPHLSPRPYICFHQSQIQEVYRKPNTQTIHLVAQRLTHNHLQYKSKERTTPSKPSTLPRIRRRTHISVVTSLQHHQIPQDLNIDVG